MKKLEEKILDIIVKKKFNLNYLQDIGYSSSFFMVFNFPTHKLAGNPVFWKKKTTKYEFTITRNEKYEIPYGCYARLNQIFIDTEVKTKGTNIIDIGRSFNEYVRKVGCKKGKANKTLLKQLLNYVTSTIHVEPLGVEPNRVIGFNAFVARAWDIFFDVKNSEQIMLSEGKIVLDEDYARWVYEHSVPLDMDIIKCFRRNPLALDFYRFLVYRNNDLKRPVLIPDNSLFEQLGTEERNNRKIRMKLKNILRIIQTYWPIKAKFEEGYFELQPSPPAIQKRLSNSKGIRIMDIPKKLSTG